MTGRKPGRKRAHTRHSVSSCADKLKRRRAWTTREDEAILALVKSNGTRQWTVIAAKLASHFGISGRTGKQCRERWHNHLESGISKEPWTREEEVQLFRIQGQIGNKWAEIAKSLNGRTDNSIKNHFYSTLRKQYRKLHRTDPTREQLAEAAAGLTAGVLSDLLLTEHSSFVQACDSQAYPDLKESVLLEDSELFVQGHQIPLPQPGEFFDVEDESVEYSWCCGSANEEVFAMSLSPFDAEDFFDN